MVGGFTLKGRFWSILLGGLSRGRLPVPAPAGYAIASARWDVALPPGPCGPQATCSEEDPFGAEVRRWCGE